MPRFMQQFLRNDIDSSDGFQSVWSWVDEPVGISKNNAFNKLGLLEQINTTADKSDYLWYSLRYKFLGIGPNVTNLLFSLVPPFLLLKLKYSHNFSWLFVVALKYKVMSLSLKMGHKLFFMWNHLAMPFMLLLMES